MLRKTWLIRCLALGAGLAAGGHAPAAPAGELVASLYGGKAWTSRTDVTLHQGGGTDLKFGDVTFDDQSFDAPVYWGARLTWWPDGAQARGWGVALDFTHTKAAADLGQRVRVSGTRGGTAVDAEEPLGNTFGELAFTHGLNLLTVNALYRWPPWRAGEWDVRPYAGAGLGIAWPHVEIATGGESTSRYSVTGAAYQGLAGLDFRISRSWSLFVEYKLSRAEIDADIPGGGSVKLKPWTQHAVLGAAYLF